MITIDLAGRHAVVTGGTAGIGAATARTLAEAGATVTVLARNRTHEDDAFDLYADPRIDFRTLDISESDSVAAIFQSLAQERGIDIAVLNAATLMPGTLVETTNERWRDLMKVNVDGVFYCMREAVRHMLAQGRGGKVITIGSVSGFEGNPGFAAYCTSKGAVLNLTRQAAIDYAAKGINVNSVVPGFVETKMTSGYDETTRRYLAMLTPNGKWALPQQIADAILFLSCGLSDHINGQSILVDGGWMAGKMLSPS